MEENRQNQESDSFKPKKKKKEREIIAFPQLHIIIVCYNVHNIGNTFHLAYQPLNYLTDMFYKNFIQCGIHLFSLFCPLFYFISSFLYALGEV